MLRRTNFNYAPWFIVNADKKKTTHIALISHLLRQLDYHNKDKTISQTIQNWFILPTPENIKEKLH